MPGVTTQHGRKDSIAVIAVLLAACCVLAAGCSESTRSDAPGETAAPVVVRPDAWESPMLTEADILADRLLRREGNGLLLDAADRQELAGELGPILLRIRDAYPAVADIAVWAGYAFGELLLGLEPSLFEAVMSLLEGQTEPVVLRTGSAAFDTLNERLGLTAVDVFPRFETVIFYFNEYLNVPAAAAAYAALEGIEYAEPNIYLGDGPDIDAVKSAGRWYVIVRRAWGDCPSGCINDELLFFIVDDAGQSGRPHASDGHRRVQGARHEPRMAVSPKFWTSWQLG